MDNNRALADQRESVRDPVSNRRMRVDVIRQYGIYAIIRGDLVQLGGNGAGELPVGVPRIVPHLAHVVHHHAWTCHVGRVARRAAVRNLMLLTPR